MNGLDEDPNHTLEEKLDEIIGILKAILQKIVELIIILRTRHAEEDENDTNP